MGTASYLLVGGEKALEETFGSTAHGSGRVMSRNEAIRTFRGENVKHELESRGITVKAKSMSGISEEAPGAYKDIDEVVRVSHELGIGKLVARVVPLGVIKG
jgi:tRNA-splicing ligase RtcB